jgi:transposase
VLGTGALTLAKQQIEPLPTTPSRRVALLLIDGGWSQARHQGPPDRPWPPTAVGVPNVDLAAFGDELRDAASLARECAVVCRAVTLARWVGTGRRPVTAGQVLSKADVPEAHEPSAPWR